MSKIRRGARNWVHNPRSVFMRLGRKEATDGTGMFRVLKRWLDAPFRAYEQAMVVLHKRMARSQTRVSDAVVYRPVAGFQPSYAAIVGGGVAELVAGEPAVVIHCWAVWNGGDIEMERRIVAACAPLDEVPIVRALDVDLLENRAYCESIGLCNIPMIAIYVQGVLCRRILGVYTVDKLTELFRKAAEGTIRPMDVPREGGLPKVNAWG